MFLVAPVLSTVLLIYFLLPGTTKIINRWIAENNPA
jgi:antibiotic biosynthesis monooxygenase (ABM) superfamily enzyme